MQKWIAVLLAAVFTLALIGCAGTSDAGNSQDTGNSPDTDGFRSFTAVDNKYCSIKVTGIDPDNIFGYTVNLELKNKSLTKTYFFTTDHCTVNGLEWTPWLYKDVEPGKTVSVEMNFIGDEYEPLVREYTDIELTFLVENTDDANEQVACERVHIYPQGESNAKKDAYVLQEGETVLADNEQFTMIQRRFEANGTSGELARLYLENKTDMRLMFCAQDMTVNGVPFDPFWAKSVYAGEGALSEMFFDLKELAENGVNDLEDIEFVLVVYEYDSLADLYSQQITMHP